MSKFEKEIAVILDRLYGDEDSNTYDAFDAVEMIGEFYDSHIGDIHRILKEG